MITDEQAEKAAEYIRDHAKELAEAKAARVYIEQFRKSKKALLIQEAKGTIQERDSYAYSHKDYTELLEGLKAAVAEEEEIRWMMIAAQAKIDIWKTESVNSRQTDRAHR